MPAMNELLRVESPEKIGCPGEASTGNKKTRFDNEYSLNNFTRAKRDPSGFEVTGDSTLNTGIIHPYWPLKGIAPNAIVCTARC